jgi:hypothetical protein
MANENQVFVIVEEAVAEAVVSPEGARDGRRDTGGGWGGEPRRSTLETVTQTLTRKRIGLNVSELKSQMQDLLEVVNHLFDPAEPTAAMSPSSSSPQAPSQGVLRLDEVTLTVEVNAKGQLSILGTGGELGGSGGISLKFVRPKL